MAISHAWLGAVTTTTARIKARSDQASVSATTSPSTSTFNGVEGADDVFDIELTGLTAGTSYTVTVDDGDGTWVATFTTAPSGAASFTFAVGGDSGHSGGTFDVAGVSPTAPTWLNIADHDPAFFLDVGDLHYKDINSTNVALYHAAYQAVMDDNCATMLESVPIIYTWDDHDFCGNDSDGTATGRETVAQAYRDWVPHYPLVDSVGIWQAFDWGRVRFIMADGRTGKSPRTDDNGPDKTMFGATQLAWLEAELIAARSAPLTVFLPGATWHVAGSPTVDSWGSYSWERRLISEMFTHNDLTDRLLIVCGDAHMLAYDDGANTQYDPSSSERGPRLIQCGKIDAGTVNLGGPYTSGIHNESNQMYMTVDVADDGTDLDVTIHGWSVPLGVPTEVITESFRAGQQWGRAGGTIPRVPVSARGPRLGWI